MYAAGVCSSFAGRSCASADISTSSACSEALGAAASPPLPHECKGAETDLQKLEAAALFPLCVSATRLRNLKRWRRQSPSKHQRTLAPLMKPSTATATTDDIGSKHRTARIQPKCSPQRMVAVAYVKKFCRNITEDCSTARTHARPHRPKLMSASLLASVILQLHCTRNRQCHHTNELW